MKLVSLLMCFCFAARAQAPGSDTQTLQTLLAEVRQLRIALERSTQIAPRIQIAVERLKLQQEHVARVSRQLEDVQRELDHRRAEHPKMLQRLQAMDNAVSQTTNPQEQKDLNYRVSEFKLETELAEKSLQQFQAREGELASQLQSEQSKLTELNDRLNQMERALNVP
jgi:predicted  nucleic acid-binding Zn-ribbon protein